MNDSLEASRLLVLSNYEKWTFNTTIHIRGHQNSHMILSRLASTNLICRKGRSTIRNSMIIDASFVDFLDDAS